MTQMVMKLCLFLVLVSTSSLGGHEKDGDKEKKSEEGPTNLRLETKDLVSTLVWNPDEKWNDSVDITYIVKTCNCYTDCCNYDDDDECEWIEQLCRISERYEIDGTKTLSCPILYNFLGFVGYAKVRAFLPRRMRKLGMTYKMSDQTACISADTRMEFSEPELFQSMISSNEAKFTIKFTVDRLFCSVKKVQIDYLVYKCSPVQNAADIKIRETRISFQPENATINCRDNLRSTVIELIDLEPETEYNMKVSFTVFDNSNSNHTSETTSLNFTTLSTLTGVPIIEKVVNHETDNRRSNVLQISIICVLLVVVLWIVLYLTHYKIRTICRSQQTHWKPPEFVDLESYLDYLFNGDQFSVGEQFLDDHPVDLISKYPVEEQASSPQMRHIPEQELPDELEFSTEEDLINVDVNFQDQRIYEHSDILTSSHPSGFSSGYVPKESL